MFPSITTLPSLRRLLPRDRGGNACACAGGAGEEEMSTKSIYMYENSLEIYVGMFQNQFSRES